MNETVISLVRRYNYRVIAVAKDKTQIKAIVTLYGDDGPLANAYFVDSHDVPAATTRDGHYDLYYSYEDFPAIVDMLRNEDAVYLVWQGPHDSLLSTASEPFEN